MQHILFAHGAYFINKYTSLDMLSKLGTEKSHYHAREGYFKNTRHIGEKVHTMYLARMLNFFFVYL